MKTAIAIVIGCFVVGVLIAAREFQARRNRRSAFDKRGRP